MARWTTKQAEALQFVRACKQLASATEHAGLRLSITLLDGRTLYGYVIRQHTASNAEDEMPPTAFAGELEIVEDSGRRQVVDFLQVLNVVPSESRRV